MPDHRHMRRLLTPKDLAQLRALDYNGQLVGTLAYSEVRVSGESEQYSSALEKDVREKGIQHDLIVFSRFGTDHAMLVEGHHRAVLAIDMGVGAVADWHQCDCDEEELDFFGLCPIVRSACEDQKELDQLSGWTLTDAV